MLLHLEVCHAPNCITVIIPLIGGAVGSNAAGTIAIDISLGPLGNSIVDPLGGGIGEQIPNQVLGMGGAARLYRALSPEALAVAPLRSL
jgi:hypothetical protein